MQAIHTLLQYILHIDTYLIAFVTQYGAWTYLALFLIIFCETGLVVTPFLPGDSLLFAAGSIAATAGRPLKVEVLFLILTIASILGNKLNYLIGRFFGIALFNPHPTSSRWRKKLFSQAYLQEAHAFYEKHGGKTVILARYIPIIRTFAPFVAGMCAMSVGQFTLYNIVSALLWIGSLVGAGYFLGSLPIVRDNFTIVIYGIIILSITPAIFGFIYRKAFAQKKGNIK